MGKRRSHKAGYLNARKSFDLHRSKLLKAVIQRDGVDCQVCRGVVFIDLHHIAPVYLFPKLALDVDNLMGVCKPCHRKIHRRFFKRWAIRNKFLREE